MAPQDEAIREVLQYWTELQFDSIAEARAFGRGEGIKEGKKVGKKAGMKIGMQVGRKVGIQEAKHKVAKRMIRDGLTDADVERYTRLTSTKIARLRNRGI